VDVSARTLARSGGSMHPGMFNLSTDMGTDYRMEQRSLEDVSYRVIGAAMRVHNALGPGLKEAAYQHALSVEMEAAGLSFRPEHAVEIYLDQTAVGLLYLDHLVEDELVVEEKAFSHLLTDEEIAQVITYLCATGKRVGLLINFGRRRLEYKRIFPPKDITRWRERIRRYVWIPPAARSVNPLNNPLTGQETPRQ
jgi:GxxExxY protein